MTNHVIVSNTTPCTMCSRVEVATNILQLCVGHIQVEVIDYVGEGPIPVMHIF